MVPVAVRDEHGVDSAQRVSGHGHHTPEMQDARPEHWVGEQADAVLVDEDGRMSHVCQPCTHEAQRMKSRW